jgi:type VI secretion system protein ImpA
MNNMSVITQPQTIHLEELLQPIPGDNPAGESLRYQGTYDRIADARREDDPALSQGIYKSNLKRADWATAEAICVEALATRSKDLQIASWLLEAWIHRYGFAGVTNGLSLLGGLCEQFWEDLYPSLDGRDVEGRIAPINWIEQKLTLKLKQVPLTFPDDTGHECYSYIDWESACHFENLAMKDPRALQEALAKINPTVATFRTAVAATPRSFYAEMIEDLENAIHTCDLVQKILEERCAKDGPSLRQFKTALCAVHQLISHDLHTRLEEIELASEEEEVRPEAAEPEFEFWSSGPIRSRADAYRRLSEAADYLLRTEPHSPTPYLVKRAVEWGTMTLPELLQQIVRNESELSEMDKLLQLTGKRWPS